MSIADQAAALQTAVEGYAGSVLFSSKLIFVAMAANAINLAAGRYFRRSVAAPITLSLTNVPAVGTDVDVFYLELVTTSGGAVTWFSGVQWKGGVAPTLTAAGVDVFKFSRHAGAPTVWKGEIVGQDFKP